MTMTARFSFTVWGEVVGSARPRVTKHGTYIPARTRKYRKAIQDAFIASCGGRVSPIPKGTPVKLSIIVQRALPKSRPRKIDSESDTFKPDVDNIAKNVMDALNGLAWDDDSQVVEQSIRKMDRKRVAEHICVEISDVFDVL